MKIAPRTREQGLAAALAQTSNVPRMCAATVRGFFGLSALGDYDGDGAADAEDMWRAAQSKHRAGTADGDNPPDGVPVYYLGGSADNGHIGVAYGGMLRSTDGGTAGRMGTVPLNYPETAWGHKYVGWSDDLYGYRIRSEREERLERWLNNLRAKRATVSMKIKTVRQRLAEHR